jgi:ElaB/YqjD/DUF883 family membrane-anchored ribosome-binding protein
MAATPKPKATTKTAVKPKAAAKPKSAAKTPAAKTVAKALPVKGVTQDTKSKVKDEMKNFKDKATDGARNAAERGKDKASEAVSSIGKLLRDSAATIDDNVGKNYGDYARSAADAVDGFASKMNAKDVDDIATDARDFVKKSPAIAIGAAAAIGFVLARLIRSGRDDA